MREPTAEEKQELLDYIMTHDYITFDDEDREDTRLIIENATIGVQDDYITGCPGYCGKIMMVIWDGGPGCHEVFIWGYKSIRSKERAIKKVYCEMGELSTNG